MIAGADFDDLGVSEGEEEEGEGEVGGLSDEGAWPGEKGEREGPPLSSSESLTKRR